MRFPRLKSMFKYIVSLGLLGFLLMHMDLDALLRQSSSLNMLLFSLSLILIIGQIFFLNMRWHRYLNVGRRNIPFKISSLINIAGYFANVLFITSVGGIIAKSGLAIRQGLSVMQAVFATFLDRFMTLAALLVFSAIGLPFLQEVMDHRLLAMLALSVGGVIVIVAVAIIILRNGFIKGFILSSRKRSRLLVVFRTYMEDSDLMIKTGIYSLCAQACFILSVYVLALGIDNGEQNVPVIQFLALVPVLALISSLPISFGGWGVREGAFIYGLGLIGFSMESAFFLSIQVGVVTLIAPFIVGIPYLLKTDMRQFLLNGGKASFNGKS